jgi:hypothetical protein
MTDFGVTDTGFVKKTLPDILAALRAAQHASPEIGPNMDLSDLAPLGQVNGTVGSEIAELWEIGQEAFASFDPEQAADYALTALSSLTGTPRRAATYSVSPVTLTLDAGADVPAGSLVAVLGRPDLLFALDTQVQNLTASPDDFDTTATCTQSGPIVANAGTLTVIVNAVSGWTAVTNATDAEQGRVADNDITLRQRRADQLALRGGSTVAAIRADLLDVETHPELDGISEVLVLENTTDAYNAEGLPPHSFEVVLDDGVVPTVDNDDIAQSIFETRPAGIPSFGDETGDALDENGVTRAELFSRADLLDVYVDLTLTVGPNFPSDGNDQVQAAIVAKGSELKIGGDVIALQIRAAALGVSGVTDVPTFAIGFSPAPTLADNLPVGTRQRAVFDTSRITGL